MGKWGIKSLEKNPDYQDYIQNRRPVEKALAEEMRRKRQLHETKTLMANQPDEDRTQKSLSPAQMLDLRNRIARSKSVDDAVQIMNKAIFGDDGEVDKININPKMRDPYTLDYAVTNFG